MCVPKRLERLLSDAMMSRGVHHQHAEEHYMPRYTTGLGIVNLDSCLRSNLCLLNVKKTGDT